jgi:hypothetical protein
MQQEMMALARKNESSTSSVETQWQWLKQQQCNLGSGFGR